MSKIGNVKQYLARAQRRVDTIRARTDPAKARRDALELADYVEQLAMLYQAANDVIADQYAQIREDAKRKKVSP